MDASVRDYVEAIEAYVKRELDYEPVSLIREGELGEAWGFGEVSGELSELHNSFVELGDVDLSELSLSSARVMKHRLDEISALFDGVRDFDPKDREASKNRASLITRVQQVHEVACAGLRPILTELKLRDTDLSQLTTEAKQLVADLREAAGENAVAEHAAAFRRELRGHRVQALAWLLASIAVAVWLAVAGSALRHGGDAEEMSVSQAVLEYGGYLLLLTLGLTFLVVFTRQFRLSLDRAAVNSHRVRALETFQSFVNASEPGPVRDAIMLETTRAIFSHIDDKKYNDVDLAGALGLLVAMVKREK